MKITTCRWADFQHYKYRRPPWIRLHRTLLENPQFQRLQVASKALAPMLWLLASESTNGEIEGKPEDVAYRLRMSVADFAGALKPLILAGFFECDTDASNMLATCYTRVEKSSEFSEPVGSAEASLSSPPLSEKDRLWLLGVALLGEKGRSFIGKLVATYGETVVAAALGDASREKPGEPKSWIAAACDARAKVIPAATTMTTAELANRDPYPDWIKPTGFVNLYEAESAFCYQHNAHLFRDGKRVPP